MLRSSRTRPTSTLCVPNRKVSKAATLGRAAWAAMLSSLTRKQWTQRKKPVKAPYLALNQVGTPHSRPTCTCSTRRTQAVYAHASHAHSTSTRSLASSKTTICQRLAKSARLACPRSPHRTLSAKKNLLNSSSSHQVHASCKRTSLRSRCL